MVLNGKIVSGKIPKLMKIFEAVGLVFRESGGTGRRAGLRTPWSLTVGVRVPPLAPIAT